MFAVLCTDIGIIANIRADYDQALDRYKQALEIFKSLDDDKSLTRIYHNIGLTHADNDNWEQAIEAYERCLELTDGIEDKQLRALVQLNLGKVYAKKRATDLIGLSYDFNLVLKIPV